MAGTCVSLKSAGNGHQMAACSERLVLPVIITTAISMSVRSREFTNVDVWMSIWMQMGNAWDLKLNNSNNYDSKNDIDRINCDLYYISDIHFYSRWQTR